MELKTTTDYKKFGLLDFNRDVTKTKYLEKSMRAHGFIPAHPLHVVVENGRLKIKDGHHRFEVATKLGLPVAYVVCNDNASIFELDQTVNKWKVIDFATSFARQGDPDYQYALNFSKQNGITIATSLSLLYGELPSSGNNNEKYKTGEFKVKSVEYAVAVVSILKQFREAEFKQCSHRNLILAIARVVKAGHADLPRLKKRIKMYASLATPPNMQLQTVTDYLEESYNRGERGARVPISFLTNETMRANAIFKSSKGTSQ
jgi:hypothetical protein